MASSVLQGASGKGRGEQRLPADEIMNGLCYFNYRKWQYVNDGVFSSIGSKYVNTPIIIFKDKDFDVRLYYRVDISTYL